MWLFGAQVQVGYEKSMWHGTVLLAKDQHGYTNGA